MTVAVVAVIYINTRRIVRKRIAREETLHSLQQLYNRIQLSGYITRIQTHAVQVSDREWGNRRQIEKSEKVRATPCASLSLVLMLSSQSVLSIPEDYETVRTSNGAIFNRLGLVQLQQPDSGLSGHHRKRLAPESFHMKPYSGSSSPMGRRHNGGSSKDSHVYVVKLPASQPYYSFAKPLQQPNPENVTQADPGFKNNGKPAKIYHWNLPMVKKINEKKKQMAMLRMEQARKQLEADRERQKIEDKWNYLKKLEQDRLIGLDRKPSRNNDKWLSHPEHVEPRTASGDHATHLKIIPSSISSDKMYRIDMSAERRHHQQPQQQEPSYQHHRLNALHEQVNDLHSANPNYRTGSESQKAKKHRKKSAVSYYYAPALTGKSASTSLNKHFSGNGKPKAFYVMEKSRKPVYYHPLLP
uniref:Uncharacterized protein n=1 Tax=Trichogramma kaykai TaxID=54128 RepID=A0ABD2W8U4_9HYME